MGGVPQIKLPDGYRLAWHERLDSTNEEARRLAAAGERGPLWIAALTQSKGRGRHGNVWETEAENLAATLLIDPVVSPAQAACLSFAAALAVADVTDGYLPGVAKLKWPNDVLVHDRKIAGILLESGRAGMAPAWLAIGIGINLASAPENVRFPATSLRAEGIDPPAPALGLEKLAEALDVRLRIWRASGFAPIRTAWLARAAYLGEIITVRLPKIVRQGRFAGLDEDGALILQEECGDTHKIHAGEVFP